MKLGNTMLIHNKDDIQFATELFFGTPCSIVQFIAQSWLFTTEFFSSLYYVTPGISLGSLKKIQPVRSSRLACYRKHIYKCLVLLYRYLFGHTIIPTTLLENDLTNCFGKYLLLKKLAQSNKSQLKENKVVLIMVLIAN